MNKNSKKRISAGIAVCAGAACAVIACAAVCAVMWFYIKYLPLLLISLILLLPGIINLLLLIPDGKKYIKQEKPPKAPKEKTDFKGFCKKLLKVLKALPGGIIKFISVNRTHIMLTLAVLTTVGTNLAFWLMAGKGAEHTLSFFVPVSLAGLFVVFVVLDKWTKQAKSDLDGSREGTVIDNLHSFITLGEIILAVSAVVSAICVLGFFDLQSWLIIGLSVMFVYESVFIVISFALRIIKHDLYTNPEVPLPLFGSGGDLSVIAYLEKNTGISMRSLWSIRLIKTIVPYAILGSVLVLWLSTSVVQIEAYQKGALYRLGKLKDESLQPGIHLTLPWPFDKTEIYDTETVSELTVGYLATDATDNLWTKAHGNNEYKLLLGGGNELVSINLRIEYKISNLKKYLKCSTAPEKLLESAAYETVTNHTINTDLDTLLAADRTAFSKSFEKELRERIAKYDTGLEIVSVVVESIHPPVEVAQIYQRIISAGIEAEKIVLDAEALAGVTLAEAQEQHDKDINAANADSYEKKAEAEGAVAEFMASVQAEKDYKDGYRYYKYLDALKNAYSGAKLIIVGEGIDSNNLYLGSVS